MVAREIKTHFRWRRHLFTERPKSRHAASPLRKFEKQDIFARLPRGRSLSLSNSKTTKKNFF